MVAPVAPGYSPRVNDRSSRRVWLRYLLLQAPGWAAVALASEVLHRWIGVSRGLGAAVLGAWVLKDLLLFPWVRKAYEVGDSEAARRIVGARGTVARRLAPDGWIRVGGELWRATTQPGSVLEAGTDVMIVDVDGLELRVELAESPGDAGRVNP